MSDSVCANCGHMASYCPPDGGRCLAFVPTGPCDCPGWVEAKRNILSESQAVPLEGKDLSSGEGVE